MTRRPGSGHLRFSLLGALSGLATLALLATPVWARDSLGLYATWGAFRDPATPRCYAVAMAEPSAKRRDYQPYAAIGTWPLRGVRNQLHVRLSRSLAAQTPVVLRLGERRFSLVAGGGDAWAANPSDNAAIIAAIRSAERMWVSARDRQGRTFADSWLLAGAASAMDAAAIGCARTSR